MAAATAATIGATALVGGAVAQGEQQRQAARLAGQAANAQRAQALANQQQVMALADEGMRLAQATPQELAILERSNQSALSALDREERMLSAIDPAVMEASQQALKLLRGESAGTTAAMNAQRSNQRQSLVNQLRAQYGPGAESSSIGQRILGRFDAETNTLTQSAQQSALGQAFDIATSDTGARLRQAQGVYSNVGTDYGQIQNRLLTANANKINAFNGTTAALNNTAGYRQVGSAALANANAQIFGGIANMGGQLLGYGLGGMGGGTTGAAVGAQQVKGIGPTAGGSYLNAGIIG